MMVFRIEIKSENPETGQATSNYDIEGDLGSLASVVCALMKKEPGIAEILTTAVDDFRGTES